VKTWTQERVLGLWYGENFAGNHFHVSCAHPPSCTWKSEICKH